MTGPLSGATGRTAAASSLPSGATAIAPILPKSAGPVSPRMTRNVWRDARSQTRIVLSSEAETSCLLSGVKASAVMGAVWAPRSWTSWIRGPDSAAAPAPVASAANRPQQIMRAIIVFITGKPPVVDTLKSNYMLHFQYQGETATEP